MNRAQREQVLHKTIYTSYVERKNNKICNLFDAYWYGEILDCIKKYASQKGTVKILDLGCGTSLFFEYLKDNPSYHYCGIDVSEEMLGVGKHEYGSYPRFRSAQMNLDGNFSLKENFDVYAMRSLIHHLEHKDIFLDSLVDKILSGSILVISEPSRNPITHSLREFLKKFKRNHFDSAHEDISEKYFLKKFDRKDMEVLEIKYFGYLSYPFSFPYILWLPISAFLMKAFISLDKFISRIPAVQGFSWHIIYAVKKK